MPGPNFRGRPGLSPSSLLAPVKLLIFVLSRKHGWAWASDDGMRAMIHEDTGRWPGVRQPTRKVAELGALGEVERYWVRAGDFLPDGKLAAKGTQITRLVARAELRARGETRESIAKRNARIRYETQPKDYRERLTALKKQLNKRAKDERSREPEELPLERLARLKAEALAKVAALPTDWEKQRGPP